jgi:tight adherence protein C
MVLILIIALLLLGAATAIALRATAVPSIEAAVRVGQINAYGFGSPQAEERVTLRTAVDRIAARLGAAIVARFEQIDEAELRNKLMAGGLYTASPTTFTGYRALAAVLGAAFGLWVGGALSPGLALLSPVLAAVVGWTLPMTLVRKRGERRFAQIELDLPELIDILVVTVEAGLGFNSAMQMATRRLTGPLGEELRLTLQEQKMGLASNEALINMMERCETPSMRSFVRSVVQGETLGVSIGQIMRTLGIEMRKRRRQLAEERAQKAPVKMLFPLIFLIFPPIFIVVLYPAMYSFSQSFGS